MLSKSPMASLVDRKVTRCDVSPALLTHRFIELSDGYVQARDATLKDDLPFLYVERHLNSEKLIRAPIQDYFSRGFSGGATGKRSVLTGDLQAESMSEKYQVFLESKFHSEPVPLGNLWQLVCLQPETNLFLDTVLHWPDIVLESEKDENVVHTAALFQSGYFLPKEPGYAQFLLTDVFPRFSVSSLEQSLAESLSLAVLDAEHVSIANALLDLGADPNRPSSDGRTPLVESLMHTNVEAAKLLLSRGADPLSDRGGESPLEILREEFDPEEDNDLFAAFDGAVRRATETA